MSATLESQLKLAAFDAAVARGVPELQALTEAGFTPKDGAGARALLAKIRRRSRVQRAIAALPPEQQALGYALWEIVHDARAKAGTRFSALKMLDRLQQRAGKAEPKAATSPEQELPEFEASTARVAGEPAPESAFVVRQNAEEL